MHLTDHFTMEEFTYSQNATRLNIKNSLPEELLPNALLTLMFMEQIRDLLGAPIIITSGYRCPELNQSTPGSAKKSAHMMALACDFIAPRFGDPYSIASKIVNSGLRFDQIVYEGTWVHASPRSVDGEQRNQILTATFDKPGVPTYHIGLIAPTTRIA